MNQHRPRQASPPAESLERFAAEKLAALEAQHLRRRLEETARADGVQVVRGGRPMISFSCNDYLNLSNHPAVVAAAKAALDKYGAGAGASRLVTGNHPLYAELEGKLARMKRTEAACVFGSGYLANIGIVPALMGEGDLIVLDELGHACMHAGARLARATVMLFPHNDIETAGALLAEHRPRHRHCLILTETVFSMDGDRAPIAGLARLAAAHDAWLMTDDAHGFGVLPASERDDYDMVPLKMGTLSKAVGVYGGYLCASRAVVELVENRARSFIYTTGLPPPAVAAASAALDAIENTPGLAGAPLAKARLFTDRAGLAPAQSSVVPVVLGAAERALEASRALADQGFLVVAIRPPTVPENTARLRIAFSAGHEDADVIRLAEAVRAILPN